MPDAAVAQRIERLYELRLLRAAFERKAREVFISEDEAEVLPALAEFVEQVDEPPAVYLGREHDGAPSRVLRGGSGGGRKQRGEAPVR